jgi:hypothetical protein
MRVGEIFPVVTTEHVPKGAVVAVGENVAVMWPTKRRATLTRDHGPLCPVCMLGSMQMELQRAVWVCISPVCTGELTAEAVFWRRRGKLAALRAYHTRAGTCVRGLLLVARPSRARSRSLARGDSGGGGASQACARSREED